MPPGGWPQSPLWRRRRRPVPYVKRAPSVSDRRRGGGGDGRGGGGIGNHHQAHAPLSTQRDARKALTAPAVAVRAPGGGAKLLLALSGLTRFGQAILLGSAAFLARSVPISRNTSVI